jgi:hypothetical protein
MNRNDGGPWIDYQTALQRVRAGLPVEVLDQYDPVWVRCQFDAHRPHRVYRIPTEPPTNIVAGEVDGNQTVQILPDSEGPIVDVRIPAGRWRVVLQRIDP